MKELAVDEGHINQGLDIEPSDSIALSKQTLDEKGSDTTTDSLRTESPNSLSEESRAGSSARLNSPDANSQKFSINSDDKESSSSSLEKLNNENIRLDDIPVQQSKTDLKSNDPLEASFIPAKNESLEHSLNSLSHHETSLETESKTQSAAIIEHHNVVEIKESSLAAVQVSNPSQSAVETEKPHLPAILSIHDREAKEHRTPKNGPRKAWQSVRKWRTLPRDLR